LRTSTRSKSIAGAVLGIALVPGPLLFADTFTWDAGAQTADWSAPANWDPDAVPSAGDDVSFGAGGNVVTLDLPGIRVGSILFDRDGGFEVDAKNGLDVTVDAGINVAGAFAYTVAAPIVLGAANVWTVVDGGSLTVAGQISGAHGIAKSGGGTVLLSGSNTFTGPVNLTGGTVAINSVADWGTASSLGFGQDEGTADVPLGPSLYINGATLRYEGTGHQTNRTFAMGSNGATIDASGTGALAFKNWQIVRPEGSLGPRTLTLAGSSTAGNTFGLVLTDFDDTVSLTKTGAGRWIIPTSVPNQPASGRFLNQYTGPTRILGGVLEVQAEYLAGGLSGGLASGNAWSGIGASSATPENLVIDGGTLRYNWIGPADPVNEPPSTDGTRWRAHDAGQINRYFTIGPAGGTLDGSGNGPVNWYSIGTVTLSGTGSRTITFAGTFADAVEGTNQYNALAAIIGDPADGITSVVKDGPGEWVLNGMNTYTGTTTINAGTLLLAHGYDTNGNVTLQNVLSPNSNVIIGPAGELEFYTGDNGFSRLGQPHAFEGLSQTLASISGSGTINLNAGALIINNAGPVSFAGTITENRDGGSTLFQDNGSITKQGAGTLTLTGANSYTGATRVQGGYFVLGKDAWAPVLSGPGGAEINAGRLVFDFAGAQSPASQVLAILDAGYDQPVKFSTGLIRTTNPTDGELRGLGWREDTTASQVLVGYVYYGDSTLDGVVNSDDFSLLATHFGATDRQWYHGDYNYDGIVDSLDFALLAGNFGLSVSGPNGQVTPQDWANLAAVVPEPSTSALLLTGIALCSPRACSRRGRAAKSASKLAG